MSENDCGRDVANYIINEVDEERIKLPDDIRLKYLSDKLGYTPHLIGRAHDYNITRLLKQKGIISRKCGTPRRLQLSRMDSDSSKS